MYHILDQRNIQQSFAFDALIGPYISTIIHDRKFIRDEYGPWREIYPVFPNKGYPWQATTQHQASPTPSSQTQASPGQSPHSNTSHTPSTSKTFTSSQQPSVPKSEKKFSTLPSPRTRHYVPGMTEEELEERRKEAGWYPGCESEEEEEPDFWEFIKNLSKETRRVGKSWRKKMKIILMLDMIIIKNRYTFHSFFYFFLVAILLSYSVYCICFLTV